jgi:hypothetical protein
MSEEVSPILCLEAEPIQFLFFFQLATMQLEQLRRSPF